MAGRHDLRRVTPGNVENHPGGAAEKKRLAVGIEDGLALIAIVGRGMARSKGTAARIFNAVSRAGINIRTIDQGSSELNIIIGVEEADYEKTVKAIYDEFIR